MTTFYADSAGSQGTGDGSSAANACTFKEALEDDAVLHTAMAPGDVVWVKNGTTIAWDGSGGAYATVASGIGDYTNHTKFEGYESTPGDGGIVEIQDTDDGATSNCIENTTSPGLIFANFRFIDVRRAYYANSTSSYGMLFRNIDILSGSTSIYGIEFGSASSAANYLVNVRVIGAATAGFQLNSRLNHCVNCQAIDCGIGFYFNNAFPGSAINCIAYGNDTHGFQFTSTAASGFTFKNVVVLGNGSDGIACVEMPLVLVDTILASNGGYGVNASIEAFLLAYHSNLNPSGKANTSGAYNSNCNYRPFNPLTVVPSWADDSPTNPEDIDLTIAYNDACVALGLTNPVPSALTQSYPDANAAQAAQP